MERYPATWTDALGEAATTIENDGETLRMTLRGMTLTGADFDGMGPEETDCAPGLVPLPLNHGDLCSGTLRWTMPIRLLDDADGLRSGELAATLVLGDPAPNGGIDREDLRLVLRAEGLELTSPGTSGWFEDELLALQRALPEGWALKCCFGCQLSDYSPYGHGLFGGMACFRDAAEAYLAAEDKRAILELFGTRDHSQVTEWVQETWVCEAFRRRVRGTGYRG